MASISKKERETLYYYTQKGYTKREAFLFTHPKSSEASADSSAYRFFSRLFEKISELPINEQLELYGLGKNRLWQEMNKRLNAKTPIFWQKQQIATIDDNTTRQKATELLAKIHGVDKGEQVKDATSKSKLDNQFVIVDAQPELFDE